MKILIVSFLLLILVGCDRSQTKVRCYNEGKLVYSSENELCPQWAGTGYRELINGKIIKAECGCWTNF